MSPGRPIGHLVIIQHGDLPRRLEECPLRYCQVSEDGISTCDHVACPNCGVGPPAYLKPEEVFYCDLCATRWSNPDWREDAQRTEP